MTTETPTPRKTPTQRQRETALQMEAKAEIARAMRGRAADVVIERRLEGVKPDVSCRIRRLPVAVEVQCSAIKVDEIRRRTSIYTALGYYVI